MRGPLRGPKEGVLGMATTIRTDHKWREFVTRDKVPAKVLASQFDYLDADTYDGFFRYLGHWYHTSEFMRLDATPGWDGVAGDSYFSATLIKLSRDGERFKVARMYS
jgi:hypothetical protein